MESKLKEKLIEKFIKIHSILDANCIYDELGDRDSIDKLLEELEVLLKEYNKENLLNDIDRLKKELKEKVDHKNCKCHISPPCENCIEISELEFELEEKIKLLNKEKESV